MVPAGMAPLKSMERHQFLPPACDSFPGEIKMVDINVSVMSLLEWPIDMARTDTGIQNRR